MSRNQTHWMVVFITVLTLLLSLAVSVAQDATPEVTPESAPAAETTAEAAPASNGLITGLRHLHSLVRWIVVLVALAALVKIGLVFFQGGTYDELSRRLMIGFSGAITLQWVIGLVFLVVYGGVVGFGLRHFWEHLVVMTVAVGLSHMSPRWKKADDRTRARASLLIIVAVLVLVFVGVALLPQGWRLFPGSM